MRISVVIPAFNEQETVAVLLEKVLGARFEPYEWEIIVVDDCSRDRTAELVSKFEPRVKLLRHSKNMGKGAALKTGFAAATGEVVLIQDADLEYNPKEYSTLVQPIADKMADVVFGSRFTGSNLNRVMYFWHFAANKFVTLLSNMVTNLNLNDMECGLVAIRSEFLRKIQLKENGFGNQPEMTIKLARAGARFYQVGIGYYGRTYEEGKKITWVHGIEALWCIFKYGVLQRFWR